MGPTELLVDSFMQVMLHLAYVAAAVLCIFFAYLTLQLKGVLDNSTELTLEKGGCRIQILKVGPFIIFVGAACFFMYKTCGLTLPRLSPTQPYEMRTSLKLMPQMDQSPIPAPGLPVR